MMTREFKVSCLKAVATDPRSKWAVEMVRDWGLDPQKVASELADRMILLADHPDVREMADELRRGDFNTEIAAILGYTA